jgi:N-acetylmuramic acid 6-phosphate etherase
MKTDELSSLATESINPATRDLDRLTTLDLVSLINQEDARVALAVSEALPEIARAIDGAAERMHRGGRLIYTGAGTSGRLGVLDASECPPTFSVATELVVGIIAGGDRALRSSVEAAEDDPEAGKADLVAIGLKPEDTVVGLTASGRTPYVIGGLQYARSVGALAVGLACNRPAAISEAADIAILVPVGPEVLSGSTRLKSGTAQKMVLNMLSTAIMVRLGKTYGNLMIDVRPTNAKLRVRAARLLGKVTGLDETASNRLLIAAGWEVKTAVVMANLGCAAEEARQKLAAANGFVRAVLEENASKSG